MWRILFCLWVGLAPVAAESLHECVHCSKNLLPPVTRITPGRKYARDRRVDIQHVRLEVRPDFAKRAVAGVMTMDFSPVGLPLEKLELDAVDLAIAEVSAEGAALADWHAGGEKLVLHFEQPVAPGAAVQVRARWTVAPERGLYFRTPETGHKPGDTQLWTQGEPDLHRFWFPCHDYPNLRFTSEVICEVPEGMEVISNGVLLGSEPAGDGLVRWHWRQDKPHVNYLVALAAGYFHKLEDKAGDLPLALYVPPSLRETAEGAFADTRRIIEFYQRETGVAFPWDKYYQVYCLDFIAGGMENTSCTFNAAELLFTPATETLQTLRWLDAHETAHQWFGNLVTCRDWSHLWLNEGFASYYTVLYEGEHGGDDAMKYSLWREAERVIKANDQRPTVWRDYGDPMQQFDTRVYPKGAWILHMLRSQLGPELYRKAVALYLDRHKFGAVSTDNLHDAMEEVSGLSFDQFFDQWLYHGGFPDLSVSYSWEAGDKMAKITVKQTHKVTDQVRLFRVPLPVAFSLKDGDEPRRVTLDVHQAEEVFYVSLPSQPELVRIDPDYTVLARIDFTPTAAMLDRQLESDFIGRMLAVRALGKKKDAGTVAKLEKRLRADEFHAVRAEAASALGSMNTPEARAALIAGLAAQEDARARKAVVEALAAIPHPDAQDALLTHVAEEKNPQIVAVIVRSWGARTADETIAKALAEHFQKPGFANQVAAAVVAAWRAQDDASAAPLILAALRDKPLDWRTRDHAAALDALAFLSRKREDRDEAREFLVGRLSHPRPELRAAAAKALGTLRDPRALAVLEPMLPGGGPFTDLVREAASKSVQTLQNEQPAPAELKKLWDELQRLQKKTETLEKQVEDGKKKADAR
jgi:aminopeptidase N